MDNPQVITAVEWFFGYGGNHLGLKRVLPSLKLIAACEIEGYAVANMVAKMEAGQLDAAPIWSDCKTFPCEQFVGLVDIFIASYPCQPFSSAGKRRGGDDPRHLWPFVRRAVETFRPRYCFFENVDGHVSQGLREVLTELVMLGYRVESLSGEPAWGVFSAAEVGAPQQRKRVFILAELAGTSGADVAAQMRGWEECQQDDGGTLRPESDSGRRLDVAKLARCGQVESPQAKVGSQRKSKRSSLVGNSEGTGDGPISARSRNQRKGAAKSDRTGVGLANASESQRGVGTGKGKLRAGRPKVGFGEGSKQGGDGLAVAECEGHEGRQREGSHVEGSSAHEPASERCYSWFWPGFVARPGQAQSPWEPKRTLTTTFGGLGGGVNGRAANVDRLRLLGNGVYPAVAAKAFITLFKRLQPNNTYQVTTTEI